MYIRERASDLFANATKYNCCQAVICAYCEYYGIDDQAIFEMTEGFGLGMGGLRDTCGAVTGMFMALSLHNSAGDKMNPRLSKQDTYAKIREYAKLGLVHHLLYLYHISYLFRSLLYLE